MFCHTRSTVVVNTGHFFCRHREKVFIYSPTKNYIFRNYNFFAGRIFQNFWAGGPCSIGRSFWLFLHYPSLFSHTRRIFPRRWNTSLKIAPHLKGGKYLKGSQIWKMHLRVETGLTGEFRFELNCNIWCCEKNRTTASHTVKKIGWQPLDSS